MWSLLEPSFLYSFILIFFADEEVTIQSLMLMKDDTLMSLVPKAGPRAMLLHQIDEVID